MASQNHAMNFVLVLKATEQWGEIETINNDSPFIFDNEEARKILDKNLDAWNEYELNFFKYRHHLQQIASKYWTLPHVTLEEALEIKDPNTIFIPIDDDDIVHPRLVDYIRDWYNIPEVDSVSWNGWAYSLLRNRPMWSKDHEIHTDNKYFNTLLVSNGYSLRANMASYQLIMQHDHFSDDRYMNRMHLGKELALRLVHPGGIWLMQNAHVFSRQNLYWNKLVVPSQAAWAAPFVEEVRDLTKSIFENPKRA